MQCVAPGSLGLCYVEHLPLVGMSYCDCKNFSVLSLLYNQVLHPLLLAIGLYLVTMCELLAPIDQCINLAGDH